MTLILMVRILQNKNNSVHACTTNYIVLYFYSGPDDTVDDLDFSLFQSYNDVLYDVLGDLSFDDNIVISQ